MLAQIILLCSCFHSTFEDQNHYWWKRHETYVSGYELSNRLLYLMWSYYEDATERIHDHKHMRFMYEESPHYELGYVMHEVIERYRKMVEQMYRVDNFKSNTLYDNIERCELIQKLYFEIYHLVNIMNEIPRKWQHMKEFDLKQPPNNTGYKEAMKEWHSGDHKKRDRERNRLLKKRRELIAKGLLTLTERPPSAKKEPYNIHWPLDYGWDIEWW